MPEQGAGKAVFWMWNGDEPLGAPWAPGGREKALSHRADRLQHVGDGTKKADAGVG